VVLIKLKGRQGRESSDRKFSSAADKKNRRERKKVPFMTDSMEGIKTQVGAMICTFQDVARDMIIERSEDAAEFPSGEQGFQEVGVMFADDGHDRLGAMLLMKFQS